MAHTHSSLLLSSTPRIQFAPPSLSIPTLNPPSSRFSTPHPFRFIGLTSKPSINKLVCQAQKASMAAAVEVFEKEELAASLAKYVADLSNKFTAERGAFTVCLSGGSLISYLRKLLEAPYVDSLEWSKWHVFWLDERVVPKTHEDSNYKLAFDGFLSKVPIPPGNVYAINDALSAEGAADDYETCLRHLVKSNVITSSVSGFPKFDLMLLGMGPDGHVASLFPGHPLVEENKRWVAFIKDSPKPPPERITFTFPVINSSAYAALVVTGSGKADAVHSVLRGGSQNSNKLPAALVSPEGELKWFLDKGAASKL
ncbi:probable 6-phosphogluconolactonase 4, chloroplastic isoform X1 [Lotus japonicus]|uniref:probable 6-phosphogluconolactonase 4, chloroplastic isoform X1 n=2 Tax=Lotus japonicus TaxID=34305 RepID=UPI00258C2A81|nr:probable 6-phosphogluconolactonase 4, chloroplastic isoform X1 [Lotus japonicus]XP_057453906.1 probable 6-phosphogluconolactonase 4, chloroplastic isoform X1 [Lotus japonicus]XP_057453915.1 probable 6-phosphogluconolactonase 4, chloroplastic isoform X1 [Lotus japonicus]